MRVNALGFDDVQFATLAHLLNPYKVHLTRQAEHFDLVISRNALPGGFRPLIRMLDNLSNGTKKLDQRNGIVDLPFDLIDSASRTFETAMKPTVARKYKLATRLPISYYMIPSSIRERLLRMQSVHSTFDLSRHLAVEIARRTLTDAFSVLGFAPQRKRFPSLVITHDIDSAKGLERAVGLKHVEEELGVQSVWFLPSDEYRLDEELIRELAEGCRIGSHDVKHDGRLIHIGKHDELVRRLERSRLRLESVTGKPVEHFRSPLLQFSRRIVSALGKAGYKMDLSAPTWEPFHPATMSGFGVESVQAFEVDGVIELPLTLTQDHQLLNLLGMNTREAIRLWIEQARIVRAFDGDIVLLVHPDYLFSRELPEYRRLVQSLLEIHADLDSSG